MKAAIKPLKELTVSSYQIPSFKLIPNTGLQQKPLLHYHSVFSSPSASSIESHISSIGVVIPQWRYTMYSTTHFHSTTHEVLAIASGRARLCFGHEENPDRVELEATAGDVLIVPAGVGHRLLNELDSPFEMVGSYPEGKRWDMCYGKPEEQSKISKMKSVTWFESDPIYGNEGGPALNV